MSAAGTGIVDIRRAACIALCLVFASAAARAEILPTRGVSDPRIRVAVYKADEVYRLHGFVGFQIDLEFELGESFVGLAAGDIEGISFVAQDNHLFIKPKAATVGTNITVLTSRRHYHLDYTAQTRRPAPGDLQVIYALRFQYPGSGAFGSASAAAERIDAELERASAGRTSNRDYWYCGQEALRPIAASDDGVHTRLRFGAHVELPAIFVRNEDGGESLLNFSMEDEEVVVHRVARRFILRRGLLAGCVVNKGYVGSGERLQSGTVAPNVRRERVGPTP